LKGGFAVNYRKLVQNTFLGVPYNKEGRKVQSLMYYIFDIGRLGLTESEGNGNSDVIKCFKNEVVNLMKAICNNQSSVETIEDSDQAAAIFQTMSARLVVELSDLCDYIFKNTEKTSYMLRRVQQNVDRLTDSIRQGELTIE
jgi:hypothetical protein